MTKTLLLLIVIGCLLGCGDDQTTVIEPEPNKPPVIERVILPNETEVSTPLQLQVIARDPDKDKLTIIWEASKGTIDDGVWTPPNHAAQVVISVHVTDKTNPTVTQQQTVKVIAPEPPPSSEPPPPDPMLQDAQWNVLARIGIEFIDAFGNRYAISRGDTLESVQKATFKQETIENGFIFHHIRLGSFAIGIEGQNVERIVIWDSRYLTDKGVRVGDTRATVLEKYGEPNKIEQFDRDADYHYNGIFFVFTAEWIIKFIVVIP